MEKKIEDPTEKNEANKMFIIRFPIRGTGNKCWTTDLAVILQASHYKSFN